MLSVISVNRLSFSRKREPPRRKAVASDRARSRCRREVVDLSHWTSQVGGIQLPNRENVLLERTP